MAPNGFQKIWRVLNTFKFIQIFFQALAWTPWFLFLFFYYLKLLQKSGLPSKKLIPWRVLFYCCPWIFCLFVPLRIFKCKFQRKKPNKQITCYSHKYYRCDRINFGRLNNVHPFLLVILWLDNTLASGGHTDGSTPRQSFVQMVGLPNKPVGWGDASPVSNTGNLKGLIPGFGLCPAAAKRWQPDIKQTTVRLSSKL